MNETGDMLGKHCCVFYGLDSTDLGSNSETFTFVPNYLVYARLTPDFVSQSTAY